MTDAGVAQRGRVRRRRFEILERQHALEPGQCFVPAATHQRAHAQIVERAHLLEPVAGRRGPRDDIVQSGLGLRPLAEPHPELAVEPRDVELNLARVRRHAPRGVERRDRVSETILTALHERFEILLTRAKGLEGRPLRQRSADEGQPLVRLMLQKEDFSAQESKPPIPRRAGFGERHAALGASARVGQLASLHRELRVFKRGRKPALGVARAGTHGGEREEKSDPMLNQLATTEDTADAWEKPCSRLGLGLRVPGVHRGR